MTPLRGGTVTYSGHVPGSKGLMRQQSNTRTLIVTVIAVPILIAFLLSETGADAGEPADLAVKHLEWSGQSEGPGSVWLRNDSRDLVSTHRLEIRVPIDCGTSHLEPGETAKCRIPPGGLEVLLAVEPIGDAGPTPDPTEGAIASIR